MTLRIITANRMPFAGSSITLYLELLDGSDNPATGLSPSIAVRRNSDGFFLNGLGAGAFVDTSGTPTLLSWTEIGATAAPGLYTATFTDPGLVAPLVEDMYEIRAIETVGPPTGTVWTTLRIMRQLKDINTQGS